MPKRFYIGQKRVGILDLMLLSLFLTASYYVLWSIILQSNNYGLQLSDYQIRPRSLDEAPLDEAPSLK